VEGAVAVAEAAEHRRDDGVGVLRGCSAARPGGAARDDPRPIDAAGEVGGGPDVGEGGRQIHPGLHEDDEQSGQSVWTRTGKPLWDHKTIWDMLRNPAYIGHAALRPHAQGSVAAAPARPTRTADVLPTGLHAARDAAGGVDLYPCPRVGG